MKKEYINPETCVLRVETLNMIAGSPLDPNSDNPSTTLSDEYINDNELGSRRNSIWDDEE